MNALMLLDKLQMLREQSGKNRMSHCVYMDAIYKYSPLLNQALRDALINFPDTGQTGDWKLDLAVAISEMEGE